MYKTLRDDLEQPTIHLRKIDLNVIFVWYVGWNMVYIFWFYIGVSIVVIFDMSFATCCRCDRCRRWMYLIFMLYFVMFDSVFENDMYDISSWLIMFLSIRCMFTAVVILNYCKSDRMRCLCFWYHFDIDLLWNSDAFLAWLLFV